MYVSGPCRSANPSYDRSMRRFYFAAVLLFALSITSGHAATISGIVVPETYNVNGQTLRLNGAGLRTLTIFQVSIYVAALYVLQPSHDAETIQAEPGAKVIVLHFLHDASKAQVEAEFRKGEQLNCGKGECDPADVPDFERLIAASPAVKVGDTSTYIYTPNRVRVLANDRQIGDFTDADLSRRLLIGFIGPHPPSESLRDALLGVK